MRYFIRERNGYRETDRRGRRSLQVRAMRTPICERHVRAWPCPPKQKPLEVAYATPRGFLIKVFGKGCGESPFFKRGFPASYS